jgi:hypothetical protein
MNCELDTAVYVHVFHYITAQPYIDNGVEYLSEMFMANVSKL